MKQSHPINEHLILISVDSYNNKTAAGRVWHSCEKKETLFCNLMQMLLWVEATVKNQDNPEEARKFKCFSNPKTASPKTSHLTVASVPDPLPGALATFRLEILFRQNASWQGTLTWVDTRQRQTFRSALELILLLDSALSIAEGMEYVLIS